MVDTGLEAMDGFPSFIRDAILVFLSEDFKISLFTLIPNLPSIDYDSFMVSFEIL